MLEEENEINDEEEFSIEFKIELLHESYYGYDCNFDLRSKIIVIGDSDIGKSSLTLKAVKNNSKDYYKATSGLDFLTFNQKINESFIKLEIWDTCGQEKHKSLPSNYYKGSSLALIIYSINNEKSFEHVKNWLNDLKSQTEADIRIFLVGNRNDLEKERKVTEEEGLKFKNENKLDFFMETCSKTGYNAKKIFIEAAKFLYWDYLKSRADLYKALKKKEFYKMNKLNKLYEYTKY